MIVLLFTVFLLFFLIYRFFTKNANYWESRDVACRKNQYLFGSIKERALMKISFHEFILKLYKEMEGHKYFGKLSLMKNRLWCKTHNFLLDYLR